MIETEGLNASEPFPSPDGKWIAYMRDRKDTTISDTWAYNIEDESHVELATYDRHLLDPVISPDGRFVAFEQNVQGGQVLAVKEIGGEGYWRISNEELRAWDPRWSHDGTFLYYRNPVTLFRVPVYFKPTFSHGATEKIRTFPDDFNFDLHPDGVRILISTTETGSFIYPSKIQLTENTGSWLTNNVSAQK